MKPFVDHHHINTLNSVSPPPPHRHLLLQDLALDTVDVSMETLAPVWACDPCDLSDPGQKPPAVWGEIIMTKHIHVYNMQSKGILFLLISH